VVLSRAIVSFAWIRWQQI